MRTSTKNPTINQAFCRCFMFAVGFIVLQMFALEYYLESKHPTVMPRETVPAIQMIPYDHLTPKTKRKQESGQHTDGHNLRSQRSMIAEKLDRDIAGKNIDTNIHSNNKNAILNPPTKQPSTVPTEPMITVKEHQAILS